jgi:Zn-dependent peptidase ImmA (M78 family)
MASVAAHEYAHAWMHENIPPTRKLDPNAVEGFCELVATKWRSNVRGH